MGHVIEGFTVGDLDSFPDDGHRRELLDGLVVVTPPPGLGHQLVSANLHALLHGAKSPYQAVLAAPFGLRLDAITQLEPDLAVVARVAVKGPVLERPPQLVVEIASPSTASYDRRHKSVAYADFGVPHFWIVDPRPAWLSIATFVLAGGRYRADVVAYPGDEFKVVDPIALSFDPKVLLD